MMIKFASLGSGSKGNSMVICSEEATILVDAGLSGRQLKLRLSGLGLDLSEIDAVLLTHEHQDHVRGLNVLAKAGVTIYANALTKECLAHSEESIRWKIFQNELSFELKDLRVTAFQVPHDAQSPVGYRIESRQRALGVLTDAGHVTKDMLENLLLLDGLAIEANYDVSLLETDTKRPWGVKQRIASKHGHLSNLDACKLIEQVKGSNLKNVLFLHLSADCNSEESLEGTIERELETIHHGIDQIIVAKQEVASAWIEL